MVATRRVLRMCSRAPTSLQFAGTMVMEEEDKLTVNMLLKRWNLVALEDWKKMTWAKRPGESTHIKTAKGINSCTANYAMPGTTLIGSVHPSLADMPTSMAISYYAPINNPGITTKSAVSLMPGYIAPPDTTLAGGTNNLIRQILSSNRS
jgi:hypothetical protein